jgi:hypothetical protein
MTSLHVCDLRASQAWHGRGLFVSQTNAYKGGRGCNGRPIYAVRGTGAGLYLARASYWQTWHRFGAPRE